VKTWKRDARLSCCPGKTQRGTVCLFLILFGGRKEGGEVSTPTPLRKGEKSRKKKKRLTPTTSFREKKKKGGGKKLEK